LRVEPLKDRRRGPIDRFDLPPDRTGDVMEASNAPRPVGWTRLAPLVGTLVGAGWTLAPVYAPVVLLAQFSAGLCQTAFEGDMDARVAAQAHPKSVTRDLAYSAAVRALGGAVAVRMVPLLVAGPDIGLVASGAALALGATSVILWAGLTTAPHLFRRLAH
jgi:hypothetical protein